jgi:hypothetical protein
MKEIAGSKRPSPRLFAAVGLLRPNDNHVVQKGVGNVEEAMEKADMKRRKSR